jgi:hypothetical protein
LPSFDRQPRNCLLLQQLHDRSQAGIAREELGDTVPTMADHDLHADWHRGEDLQRRAARAVEFLMEVKALALIGECSGRPPDPGEVSGLDQYASHEVALATNRLVDEGIAEREALQFGSPFRISPRPTATA